jgi:hypothetical protein
LIEVSGDELDVVRFADLCGIGATAGRTSDWDEASRTLTEALTLWRGAPFADIPSQVLGRTEIPRLEELRLQALEWRIEANLRLDRREGLVGEVQALAAAHPLRERFRAQLMLALYLSGRQAEALAAYRQARQVLVDELGVEPGADLQEMHQRILAGDPDLADRAAAGGRDRTPPAVPRQIPVGIRHFAGRSKELEALTGLLDQAGAGGAVVISAIGGTAGIGKTALAVHWAHEVVCQAAAGAEHHRGPRCSSSRNPTGFPGRGTRRCPWAAGRT